MWLTFTCQCGVHQCVDGTPCIPDRIALNCTIPLQWLRTPVTNCLLQQLYLVSVSSGKTFSSLWSARRLVSTKPFQFYYCTIHPPENLISLGGCRVRDICFGESFWSCCFLICALFCQHEMYAWVVFVQVYVGVWDSCRFFCSLVFCFFQFYQWSVWNIQFLC